MPIGSEAVNLPTLSCQSGSQWCMCCLFFLCDRSLALGCQPWHIKAYVPPFTQALVFCSERLVVPAVYLAQLNVLAVAENKLLKLDSLIHEGITGGTAEP